MPSGERRGSLTSVEGRETDIGATSVSTHEWLTGQHVAIAILMILSFSIAARPALDPDTWWHLRSGQWMLSHHAILRSDPFSYTSVGIHEPLEWLAQIGLYRTWSAFGLTGVSVLVGLLAATCAFLLYGASEGPPSVRAPIVGLACVAASIGWSARPQMLTWVFTAGTLWAVRGFHRSGAEADRHARRLWLLVPLFVLWSNCHLCWFYGLVILWAHVGGEVLERARHRATLSVRALRSLALVAVGASIAVMLNPVGPRIFGVLVRGGELGRRFQISEYRPPTIHAPSQVPFFLLVGITAICLLLAWRRVSLIDLGLVISTGALALTTVRAVPFFSLAAAPIVTRYIASWRTRRAERREATSLEPARDGAGVVAKVLTIAMVFAVAAVSVRLQLSPASVERAAELRYPVLATDWIRKNNPPGPLFNEYNWGGYLIWNLPSRPVAVDGRAELFVPLLDQLHQGNWIDLFKEKDIRVALLESNGGLSRAVAADPAWRVAYRDRTATVFLRVGPA